MKIVVVVNFKKNRSKLIYEKLIKLFPKKNINLVELQKISSESLKGYYDLGISIGGDGTFVSLVRNFHNRCGYFIGINEGQVGFLTEVTFDTLEHAISRIVSKEYFVSARRLLAVKITPQQGKEQEFTAVNDAYFLRTQDKGMVHLKFEINHEGSSEIRGDGLILATATGSTAYSLAAGGPILYPSLDAFVLTPICSHSLGQKPIVLPAATMVEIKLCSNKPKVALFLDGHIRLPISTTDSVKISLSDKIVNVIMLNKSFFFSNLAQKLAWR
ncbi:MAG: NAD(+)/NADH kinase [Deltaproteobacteria bacterium]|nr:NAD(+)/NADH kinase [Deltaproteobacteria bacterium]MCX7953021.1 NAD(+)/NADH kinase [Deltaproteobacteria bacterium]